MSFDLVILRGIIEKVIDQQLSDQSLASSHLLFETLKPIVKKREDAILGFIFGWTSAYIIQTITIILKRDPKQEEIDEVAAVLHKRLFEIKNRILETFT